MMASRILSRFLPNTENSPYNERIGGSGGRLEGGGLADVGMHDDDDFNDHDQHELDALLAEGGHDDIISAQAMRDTTIDDEIPPSLLMEAKPRRNTATQEGGHTPARLSASRLESQWNRAQEHQQLHADPPVTRPGGARRQHNALQADIDAREQALWMWTNVQNLDAFLLDVYQYFAEHGVWSIMLSRTIYLATTAFLFALFLFLSTCIDYSKIPNSKSTPEVLIPKCMQNTSFFKGLLIWTFTFWWIWRFATYLMDVRRLWSMHQFFHHLLGIPDTDLQTVSWERVVEGLMKLRNANAETADALPRFVKHVARQPHQSKQRMDAHDIANRLMRKDNYFIALFNKEIFDLSLPVPLLGTRQFYSKSLEFCIQFCFQDFIFDERGQVKPSCLKREDRHKLIETLRKRLRFVAVISIFLAPFNIGAQILYFLSRYYAEFRNSPAKLNARAFTPLAEWKFREFNELEHDFRRRIRMSYTFADRYLEQFPRDKTHQFLQFVSTISGMLAGLLGLATLLDPDLFLGFEITPGRTAVFYISVFMAIFAATRNAVPEDKDVFDPVLHFIDVIEYTHYNPARWHDRLHSNEVRVEFSTLYQMKLLIFLEEVMSLVIAPFILWRNSGKRSDMIIDFMRNSTVQVEGLGHLCSFSVFDFRKSKNVEDEAAKDAEGLRQAYFGTKNDKMAMSQYYFMERLGHYDQQQGLSRFPRPHYGMHLPPSFPPLSPMKQAAGQGRIGDPASRERRSRARDAASGQSPQQSMLLDLHAQPLPHQHVPSSTRRSKRGVQQQQQQQQTLRSAPRRGASGGSYGLGGGPLSPGGGGGGAGAYDASALDAMTTSKLIEQDSSLGDSWKTSPLRAEGQHQHQNLRQQKSSPEGHGDAAESSDGRNRDGGRDLGGNNGVLGLLVQYSKAHATGKGPKMG